MMNEYEDGNGTVIKQEEIEQQVAILTETIYKDVLKARGEVQKLKKKIERMKLVLENEEVTCGECLEAKADGYTICGDCSA